MSGLSVSTLVRPCSMFEKRHSGHRMPDSLLVMPDPYLVDPSEIELPSILCGVPGSPIVGSGYMLGD